MAAAVDVDLASGASYINILIAGFRSEEHTSELQSHRDLHSFPTRRSSDLGSPSSVPIRFQRYLGWFWGRKASLVRGESRGSCLVFLFKLVGLDIAWQRLWTWT